MKYSILIAAFLILAPICPSATIYVPDSYPAIQDAIAASASGDTIVVRPGTYVENLNFLGKAIVVKSEKGPRLTIVDGNQAGSCVAFVNNETLGSQIEGFTLTNGVGTGGAGGGISCDLSSPLILGNIITGNNPMNVNMAGGGISCKNLASPAIIGNVISYNYGPSAGGGIYLHTSCSPDIVNNLIVGNEAASATGGALYIGYDSNPAITNNTIFGNRALNFGGAFPYNSNPVFTNTIMWKNSPNELGSGGTSVVTVNYCDIAGSVWPGTGNISLDPRFADPFTDDFHLAWSSPCRNAGDNAVVTEAVDFEGDKRIVQGTVDMGADEFYYHLFHPGAVTPGLPIDLKVVGLPGAAVNLYVGTGIQTIPYNTQYGPFWLTWPPLTQFNIGMLSSEGFLTYTATVPSGWAIGSEHPLQALVLGGGNYTRLTNPDVLVVQ